MDCLFEISTLTKSENKPLPKIAQSMKYLSEETTTIIFKKIHSSEFLEQSVDDYFQNQAVQTKTQKSSSNLFNHPLLSKTLYDDIHDHATEISFRQETIKQHLDIIVRFNLDKF
ncbi:hypothetical protein RF11_10866 [Thelohanellus kitauei]|uniref:Uncharacterized protein n=1 Tax=Thelohanellus kitauei TaxID=669202 RepID=A0A0C2MKX2_THEKT|nr:hypothetical protein RF11_10866 [Thelohanellus kitauei]